MYTHSHVFKLYGKIHSVPVHFIEENIGAEV